MKKFLWALKGWKLASKDKAMRWQLFFAFFAVITGFFLQLTSLEWAIWIIAIALVLISEGSNSCVERLADLIEKKYNISIAEVKDYAAGIVLLSSVISVVLAILVIWNHYFGG